MVVTGSQEIEKKRKKVVKDDLMDLSALFEILLVVNISATHSFARNCYLYYLVNFEKAQWELREKGIN